MRTLILATSALHFIDAVILAHHFTQPFLVFSGYQKKRCAFYLSLLDDLREISIFADYRYHFLGNVRQADALLADIQPDQLITGNDYMREFQMLSFAAKRHHISQFYMDDGLSSYDRAIKAESMPMLKNVFRHVSKGYTKTNQIKMGCHPNISKRYLFKPDLFHHNDDVAHVQIDIDATARQHLFALAQRALGTDILGTRNLTQTYDLLLLPNEKTIVDETAFLNSVKDIIRITTAVGKVLLIKAHPSDSKHLTQVFAKHENVVILDIRVPAELVLAGVKPEKIYSGHSTIVMTAQLLYPDVEILPI